MPHLLRDDGASSTPGSPEPPDCLRPPPPAAGWTARRAVCSQFALHGQGPRTITPNPGGSRLLSTKKRSPGARPVTRVEDSGSTNLSHLPPSPQYPGERGFSRGFARQVGLTQPTGRTVPARQASRVRFYKELLD